MCATLDGCFEFLIPLGEYLIEEKQFRHTAGPRDYDTGTVEFVERQNQLGLIRQLKSNRTWTALHEHDGEPAPQLCLTETRGFA